jgi:hypothetical protein
MTEETGSAPADGMQGSAKTVLSKLLRALVDPNVAPVRALPPEERELMIAANNGQCSHSIICPPYPPSSPMHSAGLRAVAVSRFVSSSPMTRRFCCSQRCSGRRRADTEVPGHARGLPLQPRRRGFNSAARLGAVAAWPLAARAQTNTRATPPRRAANRSQG